MKKELLLATMILSTPVAHVQAAAVKETRASIVARIRAGAKLELRSKEAVGDIDGKPVYLRLSISKDGYVQETPNMIKPEITGIASLVDEAGVFVSYLLDEGDCIFDLQDSNDYTQTYTGYACNSTRNCEALGQLSLIFDRQSDKLQAAVDLHDVYGVDRAHSRFRFTDLIEIK